jgi:uncharacterized repeat protein (TIGR03803 family)
LKLVIPYATPVLCRWGQNLNNTLYGTTYQGGGSGNGSVFAFALPQLSPPPLSILSIGNNIILTWPDTSSEFSLQSTTNLSSGAWSIVADPTVVTNGQTMVTTPVSNTQEFYQLSQ